MGEKPQKACGADDFHISSDVFVHLRVKTMSNFVARLLFVSDSHAVRLNMYFYFNKLLT